jgi:hypothetical protein
VLLRLLKELGVELVDELHAAATLAVPIATGGSCAVPPCRPRPRLRTTRPPFIARTRRIKARRNKRAVGRRGGGEELKLSSLNCRNHLCNYPVTV